MLKKIWEIIEDIAGRNDKEKEQDAIKVQQNVEDFISNAKANFNDNYSKIINSKENMSNSITSNNFNEKNNIWNQIQENAERSVGIVKNNIGNFGNDTGRTVENTWLGATSGTKQSLKYLTKFGENINGGARYYKDGNEIKLTDLPNYLTEEQLKKLKNINEEVKDKLGFNMDKKLQSSINKDQEKIQKNIENQGNSVSKKLAELAPSMGNMIPGMVASSVNPVLGATYFTASSGGSYIDDAKERGMTDEQAFSYGTMMGIMEGITEGVTVGNFKKTGTAINSIIKETGKEAAKKGTEQLAKTSIKQVLKDYGIGIADNAIQEAIMEPIQETVAGAIGGKEKSDWHNMGQRMLQSGINGGLVGAIVGGGNMGIQSCAAVVEKINNGKTPSNTEIKLAIKDASKELDVEKMIQDSVIQQTNKYKNYHTETVVDNINTNISNQTQNVISNNQNMQQNAIQNQSKTQGQQIISTQNQNIQKSDIVENNNTKIAKMKNFDESAKQYNIDYKNEDLKEIKQMFDRRGINAYFDENTFKNNDDAFSVWKPIYDEQGNVADREVVFNPKTQDTNTRVQELAIHELGHDLDLNEVQNMILKDASKKENWENARKSLENTYKQAYENDNIQISDENFNKIVDEEATMSILQRELGNQEYVNRLVNQNKSVAKKIYNWVIDKLNKFTGGKNEKIFWTDIRNKFETAYNQEFSKYDSNLKYSVAGKEALKNIKEPQLSQEAYNSYNKAKQMAKNKESNEKIYKETGWYKDKVTGKMKFNFSDKDMKIANQNYKVGQEFKLKDILIHNTLFEMYPQLRDYKVKIEDMNSNNTKNNGRLNGRYNRFTDELTIDINRFNDISNAEGTLIHEIQHAIQKIEGFAGGTSIKFGKEKYKNNPGEIEARDTSKRMIEEKYNGKDLSNIMPKSANVNTSILEKMKIGLYNYLSNISNEEVSNEFNESNKKKNSSNASENNGLVLGGIEKNNVESENNSGSFSFEKNTKRYEDLLLSNTINYNKRNDGRLNIEMYSGKELINQFTVNSKEESIKQLGNDISNYIYENANENMQTLNLKQQDKSNYKPITHKEKQLDIIKKTNPMLDDYHAGIRNIEDIKTFEEAINDKESFSWGDYSKEDAERDLKRNKVQVYSSYTIKNGTFVSTSYIQALEYAGMDKSKIHSKEIKPSEVAWINGDEGQYANINQKYALPIKDWQQFVENNYQKQGTGQNLKEYNLPTKESTKTELNLPIKENINTQGESINWNEIERPEGKIRKHYKSIIESSNTTKEAKSIAKELMGTDTYVPETNKSQLVQADARINNSSPEAELKSLMNRATTGGKIEAVDIAVGERLIQYYSKVGDKTNLQEAIQATAMAGTNAGKTVQALSMLNHQTPEGQATWIQRSVDKMNNELAKKKGGTITKDSDGNIKVINKQGKDITGKVDLFDLTPEMIEKITSSKDKETMYKNIDSVYEELGNQVPKSTIEKIDSWRYFSMLANPRTHIRNMVGNVAMGKTQRIKDKLAGGIEGIVNKFNPEMERTKTIAFANKKTKEFVKEDFKNIDVQSRLELNENKYNPQSRLQNSRKTFKHDIFEKTLGKLFNLNDNLLEAEDGLGLKSSYKKALADYITSNKIDVDNITDKQLSKARNYAIEQAKEATFHQANSIASAINQFSGKNKLTKGVTDAVLPFVKTPMNVAKAGMEYNPVGLLKTLTYDTAKLRKGDININKYIDNLSKGLTGTGIAVLGYALADAGMLKASGGDDDKKENYDEATGSQAYSIEIAGKTYSLDWLAPVGIPLFTGAEAYSIQKSGTEEKNNVSSDDNKKINQILKSLENWSNAMSKSMSPMSEMSMISGLTSALSSYNEDKLSAMGTNAVKSYVNQFVPTLIGQIAKTSDEYERSTTSTKTGLISKAIDQTKLQITSKIPGLRKTLPVKTDIWGNKQKQEENLPIRALNNFINPSTVKEVTKDKVDNEINNLYSKNGEKSILPVSSIDKTFKIDGTTYRMTSEEYSKYKTDYGKNSYNLINNLISTKQYQKLTDNQKQKAIENIYTYVKEKNKVNYAKSVNKEVKTSTLYNTLEDLKKHGGEQSDYLSYIAKTEGISKDKEKEEILANADYSDTTKSIIYKTAINSRDKKYLDLEKIDFPITEYLKYKSQDFVSDKDEDGESIKGSKSKKVYNYLNNISESKLSDDYKKIICRIEEISDYDNDVVNFINKQKLSIEDKTSLLKNIGFKINKDGYIQTYSRIPITKYVK